MTGVFNTLTASSYNASITDSNNCSTTFDFTIDGPEPINGSISTQSDVSCFGLNDGSVSFTSDLAVDILLNGTPVSSSELMSLSANTYDFVLMTADGCFETLTVTIGSPAAIDIIVESQSNAPCQGLEVGTIDIMATGGNGNFSYILNGNSNSTGAFQNLGAGNYTIDVFDGNDCATSHDFNISEAAQLGTNVTSTPDTGDGNGSADISVSGGQAPYSYSIDNGPSQSSGSFANLPAGTYEVLITDDNGCTTLLNLEIELMERPDTKAIINVQSHPNPTNGEFTLVYESYGEQIVNFAIFDVTGKYITKSSQNAISGINSKSFDLTDYEQAVYLLMIEGERISLGERIIKID